MSGDNRLFLFVIHILLSILEWSSWSSFLQELSNASALVDENKEIPFLYSDHVQIKDIFHQLIIYKL